MFINCKTLVICIIYRLILLYRQGTVIVQNKPYDSLTINRLISDIVKLIPDYILPVNYRY